MEESRTCLWLRIDIREFVWEDVYILSEYVRKFEEDIDRIVEIITKLGVGGILPLGKLHQLCDTCK